MIDMNYWIITYSEEAYGPYACEEDAISYANANLGEERWTVTTTF